MSPTSNDSGKPDMRSGQVLGRRSQDKTLLLTREVIACVVRAEDEASLYQSICRVIVERGDYLLAAIFEIQPVEQRIKVLHAHGLATGYLDGVEIRIDDSPSGRGPTGQSVRSGRPIAVNDAQSDSDFGYWSERARQFAIQSSVSVPLKVRGEVRWLLTIYSGEKNAFDPVEIELLALLADDMAFGIDTLRTRRERDQAAVLARLAMQRLDLAARGAGIGIWEYDLDAKEPIWDAQTYRLFGHAPDGALGPDEIVAAALGPPMHLRLRVHRNWCIRNQALFEMELPIHLPDGSPRWLMTRARPQVDPLGVTQHLIGVIFDVTDQVQVRNEQAARRLVEEASRAKSEFIARMSHELRTPLHVVLGYSALMRQDPGFTPAQLRNIDIIHHSGEHLLSLVNDILDLSRIEAGRMPMDSGATDLRSLVRDVMDMMRVRAEEKGLALVLDETPAAPHYLRVDQVKLRQVLINLLSNAIKFTQQGGVTLRLSGRHEAKDQRLHIEVRDNGVGLHPQDLERIFEPFVQAGEASTRGGSGLGLAITRQFVELMGGTISVQSTLGVGSTFRVELPAALAAASEVAASPSDTRLGERQTAAPRQEVAPETLLPRSLAVIPPVLRQALQEALISLDSHRIEAVIEQVSQCDASLGRVLARLAGQYHYTPILVALAQQVKGGSV